jgi:hypothetical protein
MVAMPVSRHTIMFTSFTFTFIVLHPVPPFRSLLVSIPMGMMLSRMVPSPMRVGLCSFSVGPFISPRTLFPVSLFPYELIKLRLSLLLKFAALMLELPDFGSALLHHGKGIVRGHTLRSSFLPVRVFSAPYVFEWCFVGCQICL